MLASTAHRRERLASLQLPGTMRWGSAPAEPVRRFETGFPALDTLLGGGFLRGCLNEIVGAPSSGRTSLLSVLLTAATRRGEMVAVVDLPDALHPETLWSFGADLERVVWVRPPSLQVSLKCADLLLAAGGFGVVALDLGNAATNHLPLHVWPRLMRRAKQSQAALALLAPHPVAGSFAALSLTLLRQHVRWSRHPRLFDGMTTQVTLSRLKTGAPVTRSALLVAQY